MKYIDVDSEETALICDNLLTELVQYERTFDLNVRKEFVVSEYYKTKMKNCNYFIKLALDEEKPVAFICGFLKNMKGTLVYESVAKIDAIYIKEEYRGKGIATNLINEFISWCKNKNIKEIDIGVFLANEKAYKLYKKLGFVDNIMYLKKEI